MGVGTVQRNTTQEAWKPAAGEDRRPASGQIVASVETRKITTCAFRTDQASVPGPSVCRQGYSLRCWAVNDLKRNKEQSNPQDFCQSTLLSAYPQVSLTKMQSRSSDNCLHLSPTLSGINRSNSKGIRDSQLQSKACSQITEDIYEVLIP